MKTDDQFSIKMYGNNGQTIYIMHHKLVERRNINQIGLDLPFLKWEDLPFHEYSENCSGPDVLSGRYGTARMESERDLSTVSQADHRARRALGGPSGGL